MSAPSFAKRTLEWDVVVRPDGVVVAGVAGRAELGGLAVRGTGSAPAEELHDVGDDLGGVALDALLVLVAAGLDASLDVDLATLGKEAVAVLGLLAPHDDAVPLGLFDAVVGGLVGVRAGGGDAELADGAAAGGVANLGVAPEVTDDDALLTPAMAVLGSKNGSRCVAG